jgi:hypothetical protein
MEYIFIAVIGSFILIGIVAYFIISKLKKEAWEGELVNKQEEQSSSGDYDTTNYALYVRLSDGSEKRVTVKKKLFMEVSIGDRLVKVKGQTYPKTQL